ncbi:MAG: translation initiation factor [Flavobacteriales bacterium CG_4_10_14_0_2_um_filter_32_8]|nr:MAG: translation initiation factor [Flavobacteriales bacterium CG_4_10_14_0_2_um_filter_32_8]PJB15597.1 MAG: translation initiation factor [Flavobacteriales bacterium CG_4_9_14_3_um_filter_32_8]
MNKKKKFTNIVYSTNPNFKLEEENDELITLNHEKQELKVQIDRKQRNGKSVTLVTRFVGNEEDLKKLAKELKSKCGVGGSTKDGEIIIQGEFKDKIFDFLINLGYVKTKKIGG